MNIFNEGFFLNTFRELFCAVSSEDQELKDRRTDEHYGIERTAAFDLGWDGSSEKGDSYASTGWAKERSGRAIFRYRQMALKLGIVGFVLELVAVSILRENLSWSGRFAQVQADKWTGKRFVMP